ncbi:hypothetical protein ES288_A07G127000v1 [Gossypium darwinii]|uniref:Uncharacterized protein n=1 Tax=Gossypium darwinii TaxID=34276 RepID=A0A5D2FWT4_GOSDA|nr:hypothetical protein ES288_A07G127000v1 [Gossypium darwinii]
MPPIRFLRKFLKSHKKKCLQLLNFSNADMKSRLLSYLVTSATTSPWYDEFLHHDSDLSNGFHCTNLSNGLVVTTMVVDIWPFFKSFSIVMGFEGLGIMKVD